MIKGIQTNEHELDNVQYGRALKVAKYMLIAKNIFYAFCETIFLLAGVYYINSVWQNDIINTVLIIYIITRLLYRYIGFKDQKERQKQKMEVMSNGR